MYKLETVRENEAHTILWDIEIKTDRLFPTRKQHLALINT